MNQRIWRGGTMLLLLMLALWGAMPWSAAPQRAALMFYLTTGRRVTFSEATQPATPSPTIEETQPAETTAPTEPEALPVFSSAEADTVTYNGACPYTVSTAALLQEKLTWNLYTDEPSVLIYHSHTTEAYNNISGYHTENSDENMVHIGNVLAERLEAAGIPCLHATEINEYPEYKHAYAYSRTTAKEYLKKSDSIQLILDLHRDSVTENGREMAFSCGAYAKMMMVVGTDANGLKHENWQRNMALALKLKIQLERLQPGVCRQINFRKERFNQDLSSGALLIEIGAAGNTKSQAENSAGLLAQANILLARGTG